MRQALKLILGTTGGWIPQRLLIRISGQDLIFPFYHAVSDEKMPHVENVYPLRSLKRFKRDLEFLLKYYEPVGLETLMSPATHRRRSKPAMFLSFDDGLSEIYQVVAPLLIEKGVSAGFFVNTDFVVKIRKVWRHKMRNVKK